MVIREYPEEIRKLMEVYEPYANRIYDGKLENAPTKVIEAFEKVKSGHGNKDSRYHQSKDRWYFCTHF